MTLKEVITMNKNELDEAVKIAEKGTHCGMCKVDFLGVGVCPAGKKMDLLHIGLKEEWR